MSIPRFTTQHYLTHLKLLKGKAMLHNSATALVVCASLDKMIASVESDGHDEKSKAYGELVQLARKGDPVALAEVTKIRTTRISNYLTARANWLMFFEMITLGAAEQPEFVNESRQEVRIAVSLGADGGWRKSQIVRFRDHVQPQLFQIASELFEYPLWDPLRGNVADEIKTLIDIAGSLDRKIAVKAKPFVQNACVAAFTTTGARQTRTFFLGQDIDPGNAPTTNRLVPAGSARFGKGCMDAVAAYCAQLSAIYGEDIRPEVVLVPSLDATGLSADVTLTSQQNDLTAQIFGGGNLVDYLGIKWNILPDATLDPTAGFAYVKTNKPIGHYYTKPDGDKNYDNPMKEGPLGNTGEMGQSKWIAFAAPYQWNPFVIRVKYK